MDPSHHLGVAEEIPLFPEGNWLLVETPEEMKERKKGRDP